MTMLMICFFCKAQLLSENLSESSKYFLGYHSIIQILLKGSSLSIDEIENIKENEQKQEIPFSFTFWEETSNCIVENKNLERQTEISLLKIAGDSSYIFPKNMVEGNIVLKEDEKNGCLIDKKTAYTLFGSENVVGNTLECDGEILIIRGILKQMEDCMILQSQKGTFGHINLHIPDEIQNITEGDIAAAQFLNRHGLSGNILKEDWIKAASFFISMMLPAVLLFHIIKKFFMLLNRFRNYPVLFWSTLFIDLFICKSSFWMLDLRLNIPQSMIPTSWSDFSFWSSFFEEQKSAFLLLLSTSKSVFQVQIMSEFFQIMLYSLFAVFFASFSICKKDIYKKENFAKTIFISCVISWVLFFVLIYKHSDTGHILSGYHRLWFFLPAYIIIVKLLDSIERFLECIELL